MNRKVEAKLPAALAAVRLYLLADLDNQIAFKEYDGYAANLGAAVRHSGLLPALSFFTDVHKIKRHHKNDDGTLKSGKPFRHLLLAAILHVIGKPVPIGTEERGQELLQLVVKAGYGDDIFDSVGAELATGNPIHPEKIADWRKEITVASVALKLALRSFRHTENDADQD